MNLGRINKPMPFIKGYNYSLEAKAIFDAMPTKPGWARKRLIDNLVRGLMEDNIWSNKNDCLYITAAHANNSSFLNWINPGTHDLTVVNLAAGQFTIDRGWTGNGVNGYLRTNYNSSIDAINYALNDASLGCYVMTNVAEDACEIGAGNVTAYSYLLTRRITNVINLRINDIITYAPVNVDSRGFYVITRIDVNNRIIYRNKVSDANVQASSGLVDREFYILARNASGVADQFSTKQVAESHIGGGMTQTNVDNFTDRIETYMDAIGAGVIS